MPPCAARPREALRPSRLADYTAHAARVEQPLLREVVERLEGRVRVWQGEGLVLTDDHAPVEQITDQIIVNYALGRGR